jgi:hypothetical protein
MIPTFADWMRGMPMQRWMTEPGRYQHGGLVSKTITL